MEFSLKKKKNLLKAINDGDEDELKDLWRRKSLDLEER